MNLRPLSAQPLQIREEDYQQQAMRKERGWSRCQDEQEWLAKLHYLRTGFAEGKLREEAFRERELRLVEQWIRGLRQSPQSL